MKKRTLNFKLITGGILVVLIPLVTVGVFSVVRASGALEELAREQAANIATDLADMTQLILQEEVKMVGQLSVQQPVVEAVNARSAEDNKAIAATETNLAEQLGTLMREVGDDYEVIFVTNERGTVFADGSNGEYMGLDVSDRDYVKTALRGQSNVGAPVMSKVTGRPVVPFAAPVRDSSGRIAGVAAAIMKIDFLADKITSVKVGETGYPFVTDSDGLTLIHPDTEHVLQTNLSTLPGMESFMQRMMNGEQGVEDYTFEGIYKIAGFAPVEITDWSVGVTQPASEFMAAANAIRNFILLIGLLFLVGTIVGVVFFARSISKPITEVITNLSGGSEQVAAASAQVSASSQQLAEGASEQASSLEETSSSLEEISSMAKQNVNNTKACSGYMEEVGQSFEKIDTHVKELIDAVADINKNSQETQKIIKTIDEIAFQTNLLALNAAVEAARAGEAGSGFAVVAEEVRNLAQRSAEAAKDTQTLIENTVGSVSRGQSVVDNVREAVGTNMELGQKVGSLVAEITSASDEQARGIEQINIALSQMDQVTQTTAANAEESASASEELSSQSAELKTQVEVLTDIVGGSGNGHHGNGNGGYTPAVNQPKQHTQPLEQPRKKALKAHGPVSRKDAEAAIPLGDDDFGEF